MDYFYTVLEVQVSGDTKSALTQIFDDFDSALAKLYTVLAAAAVSQLEYHSAFIIRSDGAMLEGRAFDRRNEDQPEPSETSEAL